MQALPSSETNRTQLKVNVHLKRESREYAPALILHSLHSLPRIWHSQGGGFKFRHSVNTRGLPNSPAVRLQYR